MPPRAAASLLARVGRAQPVAGSGLGGYPATGGMSPAVQQQYDWIAGRPLNQTALPREVQDFMTGAFGPTVPMPPYPLDIPAPGTDRPDPRRWQYPVGYNLPSGVPGSEGLKLASFENLRAFADLYSVARSCLNVRQNEILGVNWDIVPTDDAATAMRDDSGKAEDFQKRVREAISFFRKPDPAYKSYHEWMRAILEDVLVIDAASLYLHPPKLPGYGVLKSNLASLELINGTTIKPLVDIRGGPPRPPNPAYAQYLYGVPRRELMDLIEAQELDVDGEPVQQYRGDQLLYLRHQPRSWTPYGFSLIEQCILPIAIGVKGQQYTLNYFTEGTLPDTYVQDGRPSATPQQSYQLQEMLNASAGDLAFRRKVFVLPYGSRPFPMKPQALTGGLAQEYAEYTCMVIDVSPQEIGLSPGGKSSGLGGKGYTEQQENATFRKSLKPLMMWLKAEIFDVILQIVLGQADMQWHWKGFEPPEDIEKRNRSFIDLRNAGIMTTDQVCLAIGQDPFSTDWTSTPRYFTPSGVISLEDGTVTAMSGSSGAAPGAGPAGLLPPGSNPPGTPAGPVPPNVPPGQQETPMHEAAGSIDQSKPVPTPEGKSVSSIWTKAGTASTRTAAEFHAALKRDLGQDATIPVQHTGAMIALVPPPDVAGLLALPDGEDPAELHVTLAYLGDADALADPTALLAALRAFAHAHAPVSALLNGIGRFLPTGEDSYDPGDPVIVNVDAPTLPTMREDLVRLLTRLGMPPVLNHGFTPHMTLAYVTRDVPTPSWPLDAALPVTFPSVRVAIAGETHDFPLAGALKTAIPVPQASTSDADEARLLADRYLGPNAVLTLLRDDARKRSRGHAALKYSPDQQRDEQGRFGEGSSVSPTEEARAAKADAKQARKVWEQAYKTHGNGSPEETAAKERLVAADARLFAANAAVRSATASTPAPATHSMPETPTSELPAGHPQTAATGTTIQSTSTASTQDSSKWKDSHVREREDTKWGTLATTTGPTAEKAATVRIEGARTELEQQIRAVLSNQPARAVTPDLRIHMRSSVEFTDPTNVMADYSKGLIRLNATKFNNSNPAMVAEVITHELGHHVMARAPKEAPTAEYKGATSRGMEEAWGDTKKVSNYARTNPHEGFAEAYAHRVINPRTSIGSRADEVFKRLGM